MLSVSMPNVANNPFILSVIMLNVVVLSVVAPIITAFWVKPIEGSTEKVSKSIF
jgi:hypothetical protein